MRIGFVFSLLLAFLIFLLNVLVDGVGLTGLFETQFHFHPRNWAWIGYGVSAAFLCIGGLHSFKSRTARVVWCLLLGLGALGIPGISSPTFDPESLQFRHFHCARLFRSVFLTPLAQEKFEQFRKSLSPRQNFWVAQASSYCRVMEMERGFHAAASRTVGDYLKVVESAHARAPLTLTEWLYTQETYRTETFETESFFQDLQNKSKWTAKSALLLTQLAPMLPEGQALSFEEKKTIVLQILPALGSSMIFRGVERFL